MKNPAQPVLEQSLKSYIADERSVLRHIATNCGQVSKYLSGTVGKKEAEDAHRYVTESLRRDIGVAASHRLCHNNCKTMLQFIDTPGMYLGFTNAPAFSSSPGSVPSLLTVDGTLMRWVQLWVTRARDASPTHAHRQIERSTSFSVENNYLSIIFPVSNSGPAGTMACQVMMDRYINYINGRLKVSSISRVEGNMLRWRANTRAELHNFARDNFGMTSFLSNTLFNTVEYEGFGLQSVRTPDTDRMTGQVPTEFLHDTLILSCVINSYARWLHEHRAR